MNRTVCSGLLNSRARGLWCCFPPPVTTSWGSMAARQQDRKEAALSNPYHRPDPALMSDPHEHKQGAHSRWNHGPKWTLISIATETHLWPRCRNYANTRDKGHAHKPQDPVLYQLMSWLPQRGHGRAGRDSLGRWTASGDPCAWSTGMGAGDPATVCDFGLFGLCRKK